MTARRLRKGASSAGHQAEQAKGISVSEVAYQNIIDALYRGRFVPGQRLIEADIIRDFKLSRGSVREALKKLAAEGVVARSLHRGAQIRWLSRAEAEDALSLLELVIGFAGRLAAIKIDEGDHRSRFATISEHLVSLDRLEHMQLEILAARDQFFRTMVEVGGNRVLRRLYPSMQSHLLRVQLRAFPVACTDYEDMAGSILGSDPVRAEQSCRAHLRRLRRGLRTLPKEAFAPEDGY